MLGNIMKILLQCFLWNFITCFEFIFFPCVIFLWISERPGTPYNLGISDIQARSTLLQFLLGFDGKTSITLWKIEGQIDNNSTWVPVYAFGGACAVWNFLLGAL
jgi:hypothetical protein